MVESISVEGDRVDGIVCRGGSHYHAKARRDLTTGTFHAQALMYTGRSQDSGGTVAAVIRDQQLDCHKASLEALGV